MTPLKLMRSHINVSRGIQHQVFEKSAAAICIALRDSGNSYMSYSSYIHVFTCIVSQARNFKTVVNNLFENKSFFSSQTTTIC